MSPHRALCEPILIISHPPRKFLRRSRTSITFRIRSLLILLTWPKYLVRLEVVSCRRKLGKICKRLGGQLENFVIWLGDVYQSHPGNWLTKSLNGHMTDWWASYFARRIVLCLTSSTNSTKNYWILWMRSRRWKKSRRSSMTPEANLWCAFSAWTLFY